MKVNSREKIFLTLLLIAALGFLAFTYVIEPQTKSLVAIFLQKNEVQDKVDRVMDAEHQDEIFDKSIEKKYNEMTELAKAYYNTTPQEEMILLFNDLFDVPNLKTVDMTFPEPEIVKVGSLDVLKTDIEIGFTGDYAAFRNVLDTIWQFPKKVQAKEVVMTMGDTGIEGSVTFELMNVMMDSGMVDGLYAWYVDELFNKSNPFAPYTSANATIRYIYVGEGSNLLNKGRYDAFTDISGHWMEKEIKEFLGKGYVYMNPYKTFGPDQPIKRGDFVVLLDNVYQWIGTENNIDLTKFKDYAALGDLEASYSKAIQKGFLSGFVEGYDDNTLRPADPITYGEVELIMQRIKGNDTFKWSNVGADITKNKKITSPNWSNPNAKMTKAEAVYLLTYFK